MTCSGLIDEARVTVDIGLLERAASDAPLLVLAAVLTAVGLGFAVWAAPARFRWLSVLHLVIAPALVAMLWKSFPSSGLAFACVAEPMHAGAHHIALGAGLALVGFTQVWLTLTLRALVPGRPILWPTLLLTAGLAVSSGVAWNKHSLQKDFARRVLAVSPVPNVRPPSDPPRAHVGRTIEFKPSVEAAGLVQGFFFPTRVWLGADQVSAWGVEKVFLSADTAGLTQVPLRLERDLLVVDAELPIFGVRDEGPSWLPMEVGNRFELVATRGRGGATAKLERELLTHRKKLPAPNVVMEVTGESEQDGFHVFEVTINAGSERRTQRVVRVDGALLSPEGSALATTDAGGCRLPLLTSMHCECTQGLRCTDVKGDLTEGLLHAFLAVVSFGVLEVTGSLKGLGDGNEQGLLELRRHVSGVDWTLGER